MRISNITYNYITPINKNIYNTTPETAQETETTGSLGIKTAGMSAAELTSRVSFGSTREEQNWQRKKLQRAVLATLIQNRPEEKDALRNLFDTLLNISYDTQNIFTNTCLLINAIQDPNFNFRYLPCNHAYFGTMGSLGDSRFDKYRKPVDLRKIELTPEQSAQVDYLEKSVLSYHRNERRFPEYVNWYKYIKTPIQAEAMRSLIGSNDYKLVDKKEYQFIPKLVEKIKNKNELKLFEICANDFHSMVITSPSCFEILKRYFDGKIPYDITSLVINKGIFNTIEPDILEHAAKDLKTKENLKSIISHFVNNYPKNLKVEFELDEIITAALEQENPLEYAAQEMKKLAES